MKGEVYACVGLSQNLKDLNIVVTFVLSSLKDLLDTFMCTFSSLELLELLRLAHKKTPPTPMEWCMALGMGLAVHCRVLITDH